MLGSFVVAALAPTVWGDSLVLIFIAALACAICVFLLRAIVNRRARATGQPLPPEAPGAQIEALSGRAKGTVHTLRNSPTVMGNRRSADIPLRDPWISWDHAKITFRDGRYWCDDLKSANGLWVDGDRVSETQLEHGTTFSLGKTQLRFKMLTPTPLRQPSLEPIALAAGASHDSGDPDSKALQGLLASLDQPPGPELQERLRSFASKHFDTTDSAAGELLPEGSELGNYRLEGILGSGGQAVVYRARHLQLEERTVAIKVPRRDGAARMLDEARALARLSHGGIVGLVDIFPLADPPYLVLEYCPGGSLADRIALTGRLPEAEVRRIASAILEALAFAHEHDMVHRDLKPANILFDHHDQPRIADFGLGKVVAEQMSLAMSLATKTGLAGTPLYLAPEQERPGAPVDGRTDLFAFGKLLYEMLTGKSPRTLRPVEQEHADLDPRWSQLIFHLTESRPADRPPDARAVLRDIQRLGRPGLPPAPRVLDGGPPLSNEVTPARRVRTVIAVFIAAGAVAVVAFWLLRAVGP